MILAHRHIPYVASWRRELCESNHRPGYWEELCRVLHGQVRPENFDCRGRDELVALHQYSKESVADFVFCFCATCLKVDDLSDAEKLDRFVHALVPEIRLQVELHRPLDFHEAAMYVEHTDAMILRVFGQDSRKIWQKAV